MKRVVVAKYREDVSWTESFENVYVYDKGPGGTYENVGREAETFARFLVDFYDTIHPEDTVYFLQGNPFDHCPDACEYVHSDITEVTPLGIMHRCDGQGKPEHGGYLPVRHVHTQFQQLGIVDDPPGAWWDFVAGAQYAVPGHVIKSKPRQVYATLHELLMTAKVCPWTMERLWPTVFQTRETKSLECKY
jgi:hypothetical protein